MALVRPKEKKFDWPQPRQSVYPPSQRSGAFIGPSGVGKTTTAIAMLQAPYKDVYSRVYYFRHHARRGSTVRGMAGEST